MKSWFALLGLCLSVNACWLVLPAKAAEADYVSSKGIRAGVYPPSIVADEGLRKLYDRLVMTDPQDAVGLFAAAYKEWSQTPGKPNEYQLMSVLEGFRRTVGNKLGLWPGELMPLTAEFFPQAGELLAAGESQAAFDEAFHRFMGSTRFDSEDKRVAASGLGHIAARLLSRPDRIIRMPGPWVAPGELNGSGDLKFGSDRDLCQAWLRNRQAVVTAAGSGQNADEVVLQAQGGFFADQPVTSWALSFFRGALYRVEVNFRRQADDYYSFIDFARFSERMVARYGLPSSQTDTDIAERWLRQTRPTPDGQIAEMERSLAIQFHDSFIQPIFAGKIQPRKVWYVGTINDSVILVIAHPNMVSLIYQGGEAAKVRTEVQQRARSGDL